ncbi:MAG TPA: N-acetyltransferase family protein [Deltaproteobacteria bacterium]|nr:N-acetyltransferase family protein [Deltaproteobacteria bacterium]HPR51365.1 N-acetyltransferase family protein [Deltaproteobacteria bacterium]
MCQARFANETLRIRPAQSGDLTRIVEIYNHAVEQKGATADLTPVSVEDRKQWFAEHGPETYPIWTALTGETVVGWCSLSPYRPGRMALRRTAEISYYVHRDYRGKGVGSALITHAITQCVSLDITSLFALLLDINIASIKILEKSGFVRWGHMPDIAEIDGTRCGHLIYGRRVEE